MSSPCCEITQLEIRLESEMRQPPPGAQDGTAASLFCGALLPLLHIPSSSHYFILVEEFISQQGPSLPPTSCLALFGSRRKGWKATMTFQNGFEISLLLALHMFLIPSLTFLICKVGTNVSRLLWTSYEIKFINM